ncbi:glycosyltransferase [Aureimonas fodinaquatilis]|uniref:Glycosyltransferase n=1 Tax=Aureimonas fodinaquatilis TaxID=2565783 RepID=A0A5B0DZ98_9HYPH|nr:glycosyltransferase family 4 protein [Aureimonas fodinaquatilis]KAA0971863.1 glycosyltransferase [Aureimonas fodinaquatilis]
MRYLFIHQNFPGQYKHLAPALAAQPGHEVRAMHMRDQMPKNWHNIGLMHYTASRGSTRGVHPWIVDLETKAIRGEAAFNAALNLKRQGYVPDVIIGHPGWGEMLFLKDVWPDARMGAYCEFYYQPFGADSNFDPEFAKSDASDVCRLRFKNVNMELTFAQADAGIAPTQWQASTFPESMRNRISVVHDGIDTDALRPNDKAFFKLPNGRTLTRDDEVLTYVSRNLEPYRGFQTMMRALPTLLKERPQPQIVLVGDTKTGYGGMPQHGTWKELFVKEVKPKIRPEDWERVHFTGPLDYPRFISLLQLSTVHIYLTYPFVLSWSLVEAMSIGCAIVASDTSPVREAIRDDDTGVLVDFFNPDELAAQIVALLDDPEKRARLGAAARVHAQRHYDLKSNCLPGMLDWVRTLGG